MADGRFRLVKLMGPENPADVLTKFRALSDGKKLLDTVNVEVVEKVSGRGVRGKGESSEESGWMCRGPGGRWADAAEEQEEEGERRCG